MKRTGNLWEEIVSYRNLFEAAHDAALGKRSRADVAAFLLNLENEVASIRRDLVEGTYRPGPYRTFAILEPKPRKISAAPFRDRVVRHYLMAAPYRACIRSRSCPNARDRTCL